jgi:hypothetical protein
MGLSRFLVLFTVAPFGEDEAARYGELYAVLERNGTPSATSTRRSPRMRSRSALRSCLSRFAADDTQGEPSGMRRSSNPGLSLQSPPLSAAIAVIHRVQHQAPPAKALRALLCLQPAL